MVRFTLDQRWEILKTYFQNECSVALTVRSLQKSFGRNAAPSAPAVRKFVQKVRETGMLVDNTRGPRRGTARTAENVAAVAESVRLNPETSTRHRCKQLNISRTTLRRILHKDLHLFKYTKEQRLEIIKYYYQNSKSIPDTLKALISVFGHNNLPSSQAVRDVVTEFETTYTLLDDSDSWNESDTDAEAEPDIEIIESPGIKRAVADEEAPPVKRSKGRPPNAKKESEDEGDDDEDDVQKISSDEAGSS